MIDVLEKSRNVEVIEKAIECIGNISAADIAHRDTLLNLHVCWIIRTLVK